MKKPVLAILFAVFYSFTCFSQNAGKQWIDVNYANDDKVYHNLDIHLPNVEKPSYKAIIVIYGSAWYADNAKQMGYQSLGKPLIESGFAVISINHRSS